MSSSTGASSGDQPEPIMDQRKRKRMMSNRESARRSRMRKQKHLDELTAQLTQLGEENQRIMAGLGVTTQMYLALEGENSVLRAQMAELTHRLQSLNEIISWVDSVNFLMEPEDDQMSTQWNPGYTAQQPMIMAAPSGMVMY